MQNLTIGSVQSLLVRLALPIAAGMAFQTLYFIVDLYFVAHIGPVATAGVTAASNVVLLCMAMTQIINAGTLALLSQAVGRKNHEEAVLIFNQSWALAAGFAAATLVLGFPLAALYMGAVAADHATMIAGATYLVCFLPGLALQFIMTAMSAALRATGIVKPTMIVQGSSVLLNVALAPILIAGWFTGRPFGVAGAGLASTISIAAGVAMMLIYYVRLETYVQFRSSQWWPVLAIWRRLCLIGMPAGGEFAFLFLYTAIIYALIRNFGDAAQAGFGVGNRLIQAIFLPVIAIAFAAGPIIGQNFGAGQGLRVRLTFRAAIVSCSVVTLPLTLLCQLRPDLLVRLFTQDAGVVAQASLFLGIISWNFVATGIIYSCSALFQGLGNTWPSLLSTGSRLFTFIGPAAWMATWPHFHIQDVWYLSVVTVALQAALSLALAFREMRRRLAPSFSDSSAVPAEAPQ